MALALVQPYLFQPFDTASDTFKITGIDSQVGASDDRIMAVGTLWDNTGGEFVITSLRIGSYGEDYAVELAWKMSPPLTEAVEARVHVGDDRNLVYFQLPSTKEIYLFNMEPNLVQSDLSTSKFTATKFILPLAYQDSFKLSFTDKHVGFIGVETNKFWFLILDVDSVPQLVCQKMQTQLTTLSTCGSCGVSGTAYNQFVVGGNFDNKL